MSRIIGVGKKNFFWLIDKSSWFTLKIRISNSYFSTEEKRVGYQHITVRGLTTHEYLTFPHSFIFIKFMNIAICNLLNAITTQLWKALFTKLSCKGHDLIYLEENFLCVKFYWFWMPYYYYFFVCLFLMMRLFWIYFVLFLD